MTLVNRKLIKLNDRGVRNVSEFGSVGVGSMTFIKKLTASSSATLSFVDGASDVVLDSTYKDYLFTFNNIHAETDATNFQFQGNVAGGADYNETITSTNFRSVHNEGDGITAFSYISGGDQAQGTAFQNLSEDSQGADADQSLSGYLHLFNPSSTTFVTHFMARTNTSKNAGGEVYSADAFVAGYFNLTGAIDEIRFKMSSDAIDAGDICLYGIK